MLFGAGDFLSHDPPRQRIDVTCPDAVEKERRQSREIREAFQGWDAVMGGESACLVLVMLVKSPAHEVPTFVARCFNFHKRPCG